MVVRGSDKPGIDALAPEEPEVVADSLVGSLARTKGVRRRSQRARSLGVPSHAPGPLLIGIRHACCPWEGCNATLNYGQASFLISVGSNPGLLQDV